ncbi:MAG: hypothetical protein R3D26_18190 [Cyanobacteriota/Melainabacteria group bacterium]
MLWDAGIEADTIDLIIVATSTRMIFILRLPARSREQSELFMPPPLI